MLHVTTRLVILTKQVKLNKHRFIFNLYIYRCIMPKLVTNYITLYLCNSITYFIILHTHLGKNWVKTDRTMWPYVYRGTGVHFLLHDQSKVQCTLYAAWNANNIYKEKRKIWLESTHTDFLLIKLKNNFQLVCKLTHACILFMHSAIKCLTYAISFLFHAQGSPFPYHTLVLQCQLLRQLATQYMFLENHVKYIH